MQNQGVKVMHGPGAVGRTILEGRAQSDAAVRVARVPVVEVAAGERY